MDQTDLWRWDWATWCSQGFAQIWWCTLPRRFLRRSPESGDSEHRSVWPAGLQFSRPWSSPSPGLLDRSWAWRSLQRRLLATRCDNPRPGTPAGLSLKKIEAHWGWWITLRIVVVWLRIDNETFFMSESLPFWVSEKAERQDKWLN